MNDGKPNARARLESMSRVQLIELLTRIGVIAIEAEDLGDAMIAICHHLQITLNGNLDQLRADDAEPPPPANIDSAFAMVATGTSFQIFHPPHQHRVHGQETINEPIYIVSQSDLPKVSDSILYPVTLGDDAETARGKRTRLAAKLQALKEESRRVPTMSAIVGALDALIGQVAGTSREPGEQRIAPPGSRFAELAEAWRRNPTGDPDVIEPILAAAAREIATAKARSVTSIIDTAMRESATATSNASTASGAETELPADRRSDLEGVYWIVANGGAYQVVNPPHPVGADAINEPIYVCRGRDLRAAADAFAGDRASHEEAPHGPFVAAFPIPMPGFHAMPGGIAGVTVQRTWAGQGSGVGPTDPALSPFAQSLAELARPTRTLESTREAIARLFVACATTRNVGELIRHFIVLDDPTHAVAVSFDSDGIRERKMVVKLGLSDTETAELNRIAHGITHGGTTR